MTGFGGLSDLILDNAFGLLMVLARIGATLAFLPGLGETVIPAVVKAGMIFTLTILLLPIVEPGLPPRTENLGLLGFMVLTEMANGLWFGWLARVITISLPMAGQFIADFAGLANVLQPSPDLGAQTTAISRLYDVAVPTLILSSGLHTVLITALVGSYQLIPAGMLVGVKDGVPAVVTVVADSFNLALRIAAPFILASLAWNVAIGLIARLVPRLPIFFVSLPGQIGLSLLLLAAIAGSIIDAWTEAMRSGLGAMPGMG